jgi:DedD protein
VNTEPNIKYRVTGALVLIALAVIFLPLLLDGQKKNQILESNIPNKPVTGEIILINIADTEKANEQLKNNAEQGNNETAEQEQPVIENEKVKEVIANSKKVEKDNIETKTSDTQTIKIAEQKPIAKSPVTKPPVTIPVDNTQKERADRPKYKSSAYVIQIGSFSKKSSAQKIVDNLKAAGFKAYLKQGKSNGKSINRVLVGPELKHDKAASQLSAIDKISGLKAIVLSYDPLKH